MMEVVGKKSMKEYERKHKNKPQRPQRKYYLTISNKRDYTKDKIENNGC